MSREPQEITPRENKHDIRLTVDREPAILVGGYMPGDLVTGELPLEELEELAITAGARIVGRVVQNIKYINPGTFIGTGKANEIKDLAKETKAKCILFDHELTPAQGRNLDELIGVKVMDRTDLILDIFASRARSRMAKVQVGLALCEHRLPRLRRLWTHLEGQKGGIGMRGGAGERQIETDRRILGKQIRDLKRELAEITARTERTLESRRKEHYLVSLVGYTNAGKSTLMRTLTGEDVLVEDKLFATLDTKTASLALGGGQKALLSDTVGFIRRLPHQLVASFHATLEETRSADLLLHVVDSASPFARDQIQAVETVLKEIGCGSKPVVMVFNKIDRLNDEQLIASRLMQAEFPNSVEVSALRKKGMDTLKDAILQRARSAGVPISLKVHAGDGKSLAYLATHFFEDEREYQDEWVLLRGRVSEPVLDKIRGLGSQVIVLD